MKLKLVESNLKHYNVLLKVIDFLSEIANPGEIYQARGMQYLTPFQFKIRAKSNIIEYWSEKDETWKKYDYKIGEINKIDEYEK